MSIPLVVNNATYNFPTSGQDPGWGSDVTDWASAVTVALTTTSGTGDITQTAAVINNNQTSASNVAGLAFDTTVIRGAIINYAIYRSTNSNEVAEAGTVYASYKSTAGVWDFVVVGSNSANTVLSITNTGQVQYTTDNMSGTSYSGKISFRAQALLQ